MDSGDLHNVYCLMETGRSFLAQSKTVGSGKLWSLRTLQGQSREGGLVRGADFS